MDPKPGIVPSDPGSEKGGGMGLGLTAWKMGGMMSGWKKGGKGTTHTHLSRPRCMKRGCFFQFGSAVVLRVPGSGDGGGRVHLKWKWNLGNGGGKKRETRAPQKILGIRWRKKGSADRNRPRRSSSFLLLEILRLRPSPGVKLKPRPLLPPEFFLFLKRYKLPENDTSF